MRRSPWRGHVDCKQLALPRFIERRLQTDVFGALGDYAA
jgi:hypothetical protein